MRKCSKAIRAFQTVASQASPQEQICSFCSFSPPNLLFVENSEDKLAMAEV